jgi:hypothetical protein
MSKDMSSNSKKGNESSSEWQNRIKDVQSSRVSPADRLRIQQYGERQQRAMKSVKTATRLERCNMLSSASNSITLSRFSAASAPAQYQENISKHKKWSNQVQSSAMHKHTEVDEESDGEKDLDALEAELHEEMVLSRQINENVPASVQSVFGFGAMRQEERAIATAAVTSEIMVLLEQLAVEPTNNDEVAAKFALFETILETVVKIREETLNFWAENQDQFQGGSQSVGRSEIAKLDNVDAMGIIDDPRKWFVYSMTVKANQNSKMISQVLSTLRSYLELLSQEMGECPYCLDQMTPETSTVLGCCHRVCSDCWMHWVNLKGNRAFCPLCRHEEFVSEILNA